MNQETGGKKLPEKKFRAGAVSATIWKNEGSGENKQNFSYFTVGMDRRYKDKSGQWQSSNSLRLNDLPKAVLVLNKAYEFLMLNEQAQPGEVERTMRGGWRGRADYFSVSSWAPSPCSPHASMMSRWSLTFFSIDSRQSSGACSTRWSSRRLASARRDRSLVARHR